MDIDRGAGAYGKFGIFPPAAWPLAAAIIPTHSIWQYQYGQDRGAKGGMGLPKFGSMEKRVFIDLHKIKAYINCSWGDTPSVVR